MTDVEYTEQAVQHLEDLDPQVADRVMNKIDEATEWTEHRLEPLSNYNYYKIRARDWRAIITWRTDDDILLVEAIGHRRNVYDRHLPPWPSIDEGGSAVVATAAFSMLGRPSVPLAT